MASHQAGNKSSQQRYLVAGKAGLRGSKRVTVVPKTNCPRYSESNDSLFFFLFLSLKVVNTRISQVSQPYNHKLTKAAKMCK